jgi:hypothetical protein
VLFSRRSLLDKSRRLLLVFPLSDVFRGITVEFSLPGVEKKLPFGFLAVRPKIPHTQILSFTQHLTFSDPHTLTVARRLRYENRRLPETKMMVSAASTTRLPVELLAFVVWVCTEREEGR